MAYFNRDELITRSRIIESNIQKSMDSYMFLESKENEYFDIFLSHSSADKTAIRGLKKKLEKDFGFSVYVDWINDPQLDRSHVTPKTAAVLKNRMNHSKCLFYATSLNSSNSIWMPWETGYMDGIKEKVAICPLIGDTDEEYKGVEYLGLYPYIDIWGMKDHYGLYLWVNFSDGSKAIECREWIGDGHHVQRI